MHIKNLQDYFKSFSKIELILTPILLIIVLGISIALKDTKVATCGAVFGLLYTVFAGKGKVLCYTFGIISTLCYSFLAWQNALYGALTLYLLYYFPMNIIGIFAWRKNTNKITQTINKIKLNDKQRINILLITAFSVIISYCILNYTNDKYPFMDAITTIFSMTGMYLTVKRSIEQWIAWTVVNVTSCIIWLSIIASGGKTVATLLSWLIYTFLGIYFYIQWHKELKKQVN